MTDVKTLTAEMLDELDEFLMSDAASDDSMLLSDLDGFLAGLVVGPELIPPSEWLPVIWGEGDPEFDSDEQAGRVLGIIFARYNQIGAMLRDGSPGFEPFMHEGPDGKVIADDWVDGFMTAFRMRAAAWTPLLEDETAAALMLPLAVHLQDDENDLFPELDPESIEEIRSECAGAMLQIIQEIHDFWLERRVPPVATERRSGPKVGRNEPCPCGSGLKYKRCCGK